MELIETNIKSFNLYILAKIIYLGRYTVKQIIFIVIWIERNISIYLTVPAIN